MESMESFTRPAVGMARSRVKDPKGILAGSGELYKRIAPKLAQVFSTSGPASIRPCKGLEGSGVWSSK